MAIPPKSPLNKWTVLPETLSRAFFSPVVVVTAMTTLTVVLGVLVIALEPLSKKVITLCGIFAVFGLLADLRNSHQA